ncbi:MAG: glucose-6-phosphate dehydrogenase [Candidatus Paceibacterota bacterium]|jgi:glucose-6-phosphate 1-dehydrogenase
MDKNTPTILVIFGISGDLAKRYLLPSIKAIAKAKMLPDKFKIVGITRQKNSEFYQMDVTKKEDYKKLGEYLTEIEKDFNLPAGLSAQRLFYLSVPPIVSKSIIELLGESGLAKIGETKLLLEKPFGIDLENAIYLAHHIKQYFSARQVYRVDHYLAKETAQNIIVFREGNSLFKKTWNKDFIESIEIVVSEEIGIEGRANFYEQTGALRDVVQSHLLQLAALTLMALPKNLEEVPQERLNALRQLNIVCDIENSECVKRGQYEGYRKEVGNSKSSTETFVSVNLQSSDPIWAGVVIKLTTGKALKEKLTVIKIRYKKDKELESNELLLRIAPDAGIEFNMWAKKPGLEHQVSRHALHFLFKEHYGELPDAYEQVLFNAINGDHNLFTSGEEVIETWRILDAIQKTWEKSGDDLIIYPKGNTIEEVLDM